eukprot:scaffold4746_cov248-Pinguiococcus_pyrenoidosus.AAC.3
MASSPYVTFSIAACANETNSRLEGTGTGSGGRLKSVLFFFVSSLPSSLLKRVMHSSAVFSTSTSMSYCSRTCEPSCRSNTVNFFFRMPLSLIRKPSLVYLDSPRIPRRRNVEAVCVPKLCWRLRPLVLVSSRVLAWAVIRTGAMRLACRVTLLVCGRSEDLGSGVLGTGGLSCTWKGASDTSGAGVGSGPTAQSAASASGQLTSTHVAMALLCATSMTAERARLAISSGSIAAQNAAENAEAFLS